MFWKQKQKSHSLIFSYHAIVNKMLLKMMSILTQKIDTVGIYFYPINDGKFFRYKP